MGRRWTIPRRASNLGISLAQPFQSPMSRLLAVVFPLCSRPFGVELVKLPRFFNSSMQRRSTIL